MMIDKIFIPTVGRVDQQITYEHLPEELKQRVVMVVQEWERPKYNYPVEYMVLPSHIHYTNYDAIAATRKEIFYAGRNMKYGMLDDDIVFARRNQKYWGEPSNMEKSKRLCQASDILEMFDLFDSWLESGITFCGCSFVENPPSGQRYRDNASISSAWWLDGRQFSDGLDSFDFPRLGVAQDVYFMLQLLTKGYSNRISQEFVMMNQSVAKPKDLESKLWDSRDYDSVHEDHKYINRKFPEFFKILYDENNERVKGGFRNYGKVKLYASKAYKSSLEPKLSLEEFHV